MKKQLENIFKKVGSRGFESLRRMALSMYETQKDPRPDRQTFIDNAIIRQYESEQINRGINYNGNT